MAGAEEGERERNSRVGVAEGEGCGGCRIREGVGERGDWMRGAVALKLVIYALYPWAHMSVNGFRVCGCGYHFLLSVNKISAGTDSCPCPCPRAQTHARTRAHRV